MASCLNAIFLLLWFLQHGGRQVAGQEVSVQEKKPLIRVAFVNEKVSMECEVRFSYTTENIEFTICYFWMDSEGKKVIIQKLTETIPPGKENTTKMKSYPYEIGPLKNTAATGTYYCQAQWKSTTRKGNGIFILVRDTGFTEHPPGRWIFLIALTTVLIILSISETVVLLWKRKICCFKSCPTLVTCPGMSYFQRCSEPRTAPQPASGSSEPPGSIYTCLESHQPDVYSVLENDTNSLSLEKNPTAKFQDKISSQPDKAGNQNEDGNEKSGKRKKKKKETKSQQETPEEPFDMVYENI